MRPCCHQSLLHCAITLISHALLNRQVGFQNDREAVLDIFPLFIKQLKLFTNSSSHPCQQNRSWQVFCGEGRMFAGREAVARHTT